MNAKNIIEQGQAVIGIELGSTRIKAVLINSANQEILAQGSCNWENRLEHGIWTYHEDEILAGLRACYQDLKTNVQNRYQLVLTKIKALGISAMMHGFLALDQNNQLLCPFKTWRNTSARAASESLTQELKYNIPERWSIAHLYDAILKHEPYVPKINFITTLAGLIHYKLSGQKVLGIGDASGMFVIDYQAGDYHQDKLNTFDLLAEKSGYTNFKLKEILPEVLTAGQDAGTLTAAGALILDPAGDLKPGCPLCPPEGDAGTGMVATNTVKPRTGNVSVGTSIFAMLVLEHELKALLREVDNVATPDGSPVAMVHANNCSSELNAQIAVFTEFADRLGLKLNSDAIFKVLFEAAQNGDADCGGLNIVPYFSGEFITKITEGRPLFIRKANAAYNLNNLMRSHLNAAFCALRIGFDILNQHETIRIERLVGHGGLFKTPGIAQSIMANALNAPVEVMSTASEGGAYGIALLASYLGHQESLVDFLKRRVFIDAQSTTIASQSQLTHGFDQYLKMHKQCLEVEKLAVKLI